MREEGLRQMDRQATKEEEAVCPNEKRNPLRVYKTTLTRMESR